MTENSETVLHFIGIDVQVRRGCTYAVLDSNGFLIDSGWTDKGSVENPDSMNRTIRGLVDLVEKHSKGSAESVAVGIDAPRMPLPEKRKWYWERKTRSWRPRRSSEAGFGRHCEVIIKAHSVANPQWTPTFLMAKPWMQVGFKLFQALAIYQHVHEVFPSASYCMLENNRDMNVQINFAHFAPGPKDMLDACMAAVTVKEFLTGHGERVGGGDGLGTIVLPRPIKCNRIEEVFIWPPETK